jgi:4-hydroxy-tetrahydrodipicolinate reductase
MATKEAQVTTRRVPNLAPGLDPRAIRVALFGLGAIGQAVAKAARLRPGLHVVAAVDVDPAKTGRDLGELCGDGGWGIPVQGPDADLAGAEVVIHTTGSFMTDVAPQLQALLTRGVRVVSSTEELAYPWLRHPELADRLDAVARENDAAVVGVGVNPGFAMDALPLVLSTVCRSVRQVRVARVVDTSRRRLNLQKKTGAGMTPDEFAEAIAGGRMGHIGLAESAVLLALGLGRRADAVEDQIEPIIASGVRQSEFLTVQPGQVAGLHQVARAVAGTDVVAELALTMSLGEVEDLDAVRIFGDPDLEMGIPGGLPGDIATVATLLNTVPRIRGAIGLRTVLDLPLPHVAS